MSSEVVNDTTSQINIGDNNTEDIDTEPSPELSQQTVPIRCLGIFTFFSFLLFLFFGIATFIMTFDVSAPSQIKTYKIVTGVFLFSGVFTGLLTVCLIDKNYRRARK